MWNNLEGEINKKTSYQAFVCLEKPYTCRSQNSILRNEKLIPGVPIYEFIFIENNGSVTDILGMVYKPVVTHIRYI